jgi:formamidopyrimidine-DNA glycosylase
MPEGPEINFFSVFLKKKLNNYKMIEIKSFTNKPVILPTNWDGDILDVGCKGKLLWFYVSGKNNNYYMHIHYGITGWFVLDKPESNIKFELVFENRNKKELILYMRDKRRFSKINIYSEEEHYKIIDKLGIDLFSQEFSLNQFIEIIKSKKTQLAALLLKQEIFCGIGNYIKNEALYMSNLKATIKTSELSDKDIKILYNNILFISFSTLLEMLIGSNIDKFIDKNKIHNMPKKLEVPYHYKIYGREYTDDGQKVLKIKVAGRDSYCIKEMC